ncbi:hypothetical protein DENSPDRAFT_854368 [Dentipellis sp. KUC8613]|nr:hypothetical protein DENSPDRAFT_854368 [Dentipellis sp. KUC8613]
MYIRVGTSPVIVATNAVYVLAVLNAALLFYRLFHAYHPTDNELIGQQLQYHGDDFPFHPPAKATGPYTPLVLPDIVYTVEDSARLMVDNASASAWWQTLPTDWGYVRLGEHRRIFALAMSHQRHCLTFISRSIAKRLPADAHLQHCFNYLRQQILCAADGTLEDPGWAATRQGWEEVRVVGRERVCRDWRIVEELVDENFADWRLYRQEHVIEP